MHLFNTKFLTVKFYVGPNTYHCKIGEEAVSAAQNNGITLRIKILLQEIGERLLRRQQKPTLQKG